MTQPRVFDPTILAQRTARGVVSVQNTGDQPIRFGVQIGVGEDRPLVGFVSQSQAQMVTSVLVPPGQTRPVTVFIPLPEDPGSKVFVVSINQLDPAGRFVRELDTRRFEGLASVGELPVEIPVEPEVRPGPRFNIGDLAGFADGRNGRVTSRSRNPNTGQWQYFIEGLGGAWQESDLFPFPEPEVEPPAAEALGPLFGGLPPTPEALTFFGPVPVEPAAPVTPAPKSGDIALDSVTGFEDIAAGTGTSGELLFSNPKGGTNPLSFSWRALGPRRVFSTPTATMEVTPVAGRNTIPITVGISPDAPRGPYSLEVTVEFQGLRLATQTFPRVFEVLAAPEVAEPAVPAEVAEPAVAAPVEPPTVTPAFRYRDIILDEARGFTNTAPGTFTRGEILFRNPKGGTTRLDIRERVLDPGRVPQTDFITHVVDPVPGVNRLRVSQLLPAAAPLGLYFLEVIVGSEGRLIDSRVFPRVFRVTAAPAPTVEEPALAPTVPALVPVPTEPALVEPALVEPVVPMAPRPAPAGTVIAQSFRFVDPQVDALANAMMVMELRNTNDFPALVLVRLELRPLNLPLHPVESFGFPLTLPPNETFPFRTPVQVTPFQGGPGGVPPGTYSVALTVSDPQVIDRIVSTRQFNNVLTITGAGPRAAPAGSVRPTRAQFDTPIVQAPISEPNRITIGVRNNNDFPVRQRVLASLVTARLGTKVLDFFDPTTGMTVDLEPGATVDVTRSLEFGTYAGLAAGGYHVDVALRDAFTAQTVTQQRFTNVFTVRPSATAPAQLLGAGDVFVRMPVANPTRAARGQVVLIDVDIENLTAKAGAVSVRLTLADIGTIDLGVLSTRLDPRGVGRVTFRWTVPTDTRLGTYLARVQVFDLDRPSVRLATQDYSGVVSVVA